MLFAQAKASGVWRAVGSFALVLGCLSCAVRQPAPSVVTPEVRARCLATLREGMRSGEFWPSIHAAEALTLAGHGDEVREGLEPKLKTETDDRKRCGLARELVRAGDHANAAVMLGILAKKDTYAHAHAAESLFKVGEIGDGRLLRQAFAREEKPKLQLLAAAALGRRGSREAMALLRRKLTDRDADLRRIAAWVLARIGDASDIPQLRENAAREKDPVKRSLCEHALAALGDARGREALLRNLASEDPAIRTYAATFAGDARMTPAARELIRLLDDAVLDVRIRAAQSLLALPE